MEYTGGGQRRTPMHTAARVLTAAGLLASLGALGSGCLTRKVSGEPPTTKINYTQVIRQSAIDKIDLLFAIDNSTSMGDKQALFAEAVPDLINRLLTPNCLRDSDGAVVAPTSGGCPPNTKPEFTPVQDIHIGIVSSSIGSYGTVQCDPAVPGKQNDDKGRLLVRATAGSSPKTQPFNFLSWLPTVEANKDKKPIDGTTAYGRTGDVARERDLLENDFKAMVTGTADHGCGYEGQLESVYRFLIQPDPWESYSLPGGENNRDAVVSLNGIDKVILQQRANFLREDSLVAVVMLTDENENTIDPLALQAHSWLYESGSQVAGGTPACSDPAKGPNSQECFSCYQDGAKGTPCYQKPLDRELDGFNVRFFEPKRRFGYDPRFPIERYTTGFTQAKVPDRRGEHPDNSFNYVGNPNCTNPLFAKASSLADAAANPDNPDKLCNLTKSDRSSDLIFYAIIGGVPWQMLTDKPDDLNDNNPGVFKDKLNDDDWRRILGQDPLRYNFDGINPRMRESIAKREGVTGTDWRDWDTKNDDLQYACVFPLKAPRDCTKPENKDACDCARPTDSPLCDATTKTTQTKGKAYPTVSQLSVARTLRDQGIVASLCPREITNTDSADYGYRPAVRTIVNRLKDALSERCIPQPLEEEADGTVPCLITELLPSGDQATACDPAKGLEQPEAGVLDRYRKQQQANNATPDELARPLCVIKQLKGADLVNNSCVKSNKGGWCYVSREKVPTEKCAQSIKFPELDTLRPPNGALVSLQCIEQPPSAGADAGP
ncbi:hypothetical protein LZC95_25350 [Pendulispora brunnea]|uniref:VWA domain-containing protein n=1 Tax=Pendulispora brunnea TaxID=2905690 RepID=A0ABZ2KNA3_9BACT